MAPSHEEAAGKSAAYSETMKAKMGSTLTYNHEAGMNWARVTPQLIVGSCLQTAADVDKLKAEGVSVVFCLQEDRDMKHFDLDITPIQQRAAEVGIAHVREPIRDFDPFSLRRRMPAVVKRLAQEMAAAPGTAYIHCTAGMGRAPGTALAYMFWADGMCLDEAHRQLLEVRKCHPQIAAIRTATYDILSGTGGLRPVRISYVAPGASVVEVAGLDVGWGTRLRLDREPDSDRFSIVRDLPVGDFPCKFIIDGDWRTSPELATVQDGDNVNNLLSVGPDETDAAAVERYRRLLSPGGRPTEEEQQLIWHALDVSKP